MFPKNAIELAKGWARHMKKERAQQEEQRRPTPEAETCEHGYYTLEALLTASKIAKERERERCAHIVEVLAHFMETGAGPLASPGARLRQASESIRRGEPETLWTPDMQEDKDVWLPTPKCGHGAQSQTFACRECGAFPEEEPRRESPTNDGEYVRVKIERYMAEQAELRDLREGNEARWQDLYEVAKDIQNEEWLKGRAIGDVLDRALAGLDATDCAGDPREEEFRKKYETVGVSLETLPGEGRMPAEPNMQCAPPEPESHSSGNGQTSAPRRVSEQGPMGDGEPPEPDTDPDEGASVSSPLSRAQEQAIRADENHKVRVAVLHSLRSISRLIEHEEDAYWDERCMGVERAIQELQEEWKRMAKAKAGAK